LGLVREISDLVDIHYVRQKGAQGPGACGVVRPEVHRGGAFRGAVGGRCDVPCLQQMLEVYQRCGGTVLGVQEVRAEDTGKYGMVRPEHMGPGLYLVKDLVEKPGPKEAPSTSKGTKTIASSIIVR